MAAKHLFILTLILSSGIAALNAQDSKETGNALNAQDSKSIESVTNNNLSSDTEDFKSDTCTKEQLDELQLEYSDCLNKADKILFQAFTSDAPDIQSAICNQIKGNLLCMEKHIPKCFSNEHLQLKKNNFLFGHWEKARNESDFLGKSFIVTCPFLNQFEKDFVKELTGADKCSYDKLDDLAEAKNVCLREALEDFTKIITGVTLLRGTPFGKELFLKGNCDFFRQTEFCKYDFLECLSDKKKVEILFKSAELWTSREITIQNTIDENFSFQKNCPISIKGKI